MNLIVNEEPTEVVSTRVLDLLRERGIDAERSGIAVAVNGSVVPRRSWPEQELREGDEVEVITAMQGG